MIMYGGVSMNAWLKLSVHDSHQRDDMCTYTCHTKRIKWIVKNKAYMKMFEHKKAKQVWDFISAIHIRLNFCGLRLEWI